MPKRAFQRLFRAPASGDVAVFSGALGGSDVQRYQLGGAGRSQPAWLPDSSGFAVAVPGADYRGVSLARYSVHTAPGADGLIPGLTIASSAIVPAIAP